MRNCPRILVIDDDKRICELIELYLRKEMFEIGICHDGAQALEVFRKNPPSLVILDIMLPNQDGYQVCHEIRKISNIPIIMLTAKGENFDKVLGLELGADDYMVKPFDPKELIARVKAVLRRFQPQSSNIRQIAYPDLYVNLNEHQVVVRNQSIELKPKEMELLYFLVSHANKVFTRDQLLEQVWGYEFLGDSRTVDVHINRLRQKLQNKSNAWELKTIWGVGYKFEVK